MTDPAAAKAALRTAMAARRAEAHAAAVSVQAHAARLLDALGDEHFVEGPEDGPVAAYWPMRSEADPRPALAALHARGVPLALPVVAGRGMPLIFRAWAPGVALVPGGFGVLVPADGPPVVPRVLVVPLLAFDRAGFRLGYGGGFYDRTLAALRAAGPVLAVGFAYAAQEVPHVPRTIDDQRLDRIVTETETIRPEGTA
jgi:5-formyltetrahydrofolate cyclo-ligase